MIIRRVKKKVQKVKPPPSRNLLFFLFQYKRMNRKCYRVPDVKRQVTWHASFPVRFVPSMIRRSLELAASLLRHRSAAETRHKRNDGSLATVRAICFAMIRLFLFHIQFFCSTFLVHQIWGESRIWMPQASQKRLAMCKMNNSREGTFTCPSGNSFICTFNFF